MFESTTSILNLTTWEPVKITSCNNAFYGNLGCHPYIFLELGCYTECCATSVNHSDYSDVSSIQGVVTNQTSVTVTCDTGYTHITLTDTTVCNHATGMFSPVLECIPNTNECLSESTCSDGSPLCLDIIGGHICLPTLSNISETSTSLSLEGGTIIDLLLSTTDSVTATRVENNSLLVNNVYFLSNPRLYYNTYDIFFDLSDVNYTDITNNTLDTHMSYKTPPGLYILL